MSTHPAVHSRASWSFWKSTRLGEVGFKRLRGRCGGLFPGRIRPMAVPLVAVVLLRWAHYLRAAAVGQADVREGRLEVLLAASMASLTLPRGHHL